jgi:hypothetical protein
MERAYIGTKVILAEPMREMVFLCGVKGVQWDPGREDRSGYKVRYEDGYVSWSPKETFERAYRLVTEEEKIMVTGK